MGESELSMNIDIQSIADEKIKSMHESGQIRDRIEKGIEKTVLDAIDGAISGYEIRRTIEKNVSENVSRLITDIGFSAYNGFIAETIKQITEGVMREDVSLKIQNMFTELLVIKHEGIKLSEIFDAYRKWVCEDVEESEKWERRVFVCELDEHESGNFTHYEIKFNDEKLRSYDHPQIEFTMCRYKEEPKTTISGLSLDGKSLNNTFSLGHMSKIQALLANLYFNKTEIILDIDDVNDENCFDIDD